MSEGIFTTEFHFQAHTEQLTHILKQPSEDMILRRNHELRKNPGVIRDLGIVEGQRGDGWGRIIATIPFIIYYRAIRQGYKLNCRDKEHRQKELHRFLATDIGKLCLVGQGA